MQKKTTNGFSQSNIFTLFASTHNQTINTRKRHGLNEVISIASLRFCKKFLKHIKKKIKIFICTVFCLF